MRLRAASLAALACAAMLPLSASAAAKPLCQQIKDAKGDDYITVDAPTVSAHDGALDIVGGDIATNAKSITAVIRLAKLSQPPSSAPAGYQLTFGITGADDLFYLDATVGAATATFDVGYTARPLVVISSNTSIGKATGVLDKRHNEIRISAPLAAFASRVKLKPGKSKFSSLHIDTVRQSAGGHGPFADAADGTKSYVMGTATCVSVGK